MKKITSLISATALAMSVAGIVPLSAGAEGDVVYGTMNIPYADFYRAELSGSANEYEVDAVSSATTSKWSKNGEGELFEGTYNQANDDGTGTILGVTYPVALTQADLDSLGENNYNFTAVDYVPSAYKTVTIEEGKAVFSAVQDETPVTASDASIKLSTSTPWGDYLIDVENAPEMNAIYGATIKTTDGSVYAMWHEANIWRGELAWSSGIKTSEPHGNTLPYENFVNLMGSTISEVSFITLDGYTNIPTETYVPVKFDGAVNVSESSSGTGKTTFTTENFPDDYAKSYSIADNFTVTDGEISYTDAMAGSYTLTVSDSSGKYADMTASFTLTSDSMPASYKDGALIKADGADDNDFNNFVKNISTVTVNGTEYSASGRGSIKIIGEDGKIDTSASSKDSKIFEGSDSYNISVKSAGYNKSLEFTMEVGGNAETPATTTAKNNNSSSNGTTTKSNSSSSSTTGKESPKTGVAGVAVPVAVMACAVATAFAVKKKNK